jgi:hypothetical protein
MQKTSYSVGPKFFGTTKRSSSKIIENPGSTRETGARLAQGPTIPTNLSRPTLPSGGPAKTQPETPSWTKSKDSTHLPTATKSPTSIRPMRRLPIFQCQSTSQKRIRTKWTKAAIATTNPGTISIGKNTLTTHSGTTSQGTTHRPCLLPISTTPNLPAPNTSISKKALTQDPALLQRRRKASPLWRGGQLSLCGQVSGGLRYGRHQVQYWPHQSSRCASGGGKRIDLQHRRQSAQDWQR